MGYKIVITCDRTLVSRYNGLLFFGFVASMPKTILPDWIYYPFFCPSVKVDENGRLKHANYGMRKIEGSLIAGGFSRDEVAVVHPDYIDKAVDENTKVVAITSIDPLGIGPLTSTCTELFNGKGRMAAKLKEVLDSPSINKYKPTVILGGPGSWQLSAHPERMDELGIHHVVVGEGDITAPKLIKEIINGENGTHPKIIDGEVAYEENIADIVNPSIIGLVEATRGCARSCAFCVPSVRKVRSMPLNRIMNEVKVNVDSGENGIILHGEDILLYQSDGLEVNSEAVINLFREVKNYAGINWVYGVHTSFSSVVSSPRTIEEISKILNLTGKNNKVNYFQVGIESGSPRLIRKHMKGKVYPFEAEEWPDVVRDGFRILNENHFIPCTTLILGLPGEEEEDIQQSIDLVRSLKQYKSLIVPMLFTPLETTRLEYSKGLYKSDFKPEHYELITACWEHNLNWTPLLWSHYGYSKNAFVRFSMDLVFRATTKLILARMRYTAKKHGARLY